MIIKYIYIIIFFLFFILVIQNKKEFFINKHTNHTTILNTTNPTYNTNQNIICLLGDSVFSNEKYVKHNENILYILTHTIPNQYKIINYAKDYSRLNNLDTQIHKLNSFFQDYKYTIPKIYIFISIGGNDILNINKTNSAYYNFHLLNNLFYSFLNKIYYIFYLLHSHNIYNYKIFVCNIYFINDTNFINKFYYYFYFVKYWNYLIHKHTYIGYDILDLHTHIQNSSDLVYDIEPSKIGGNKIVLLMYEKIITQ